VLAHVLRCDGFGNLVIDARAQQLAAAGMQPGSALALRHAGSDHAASYVATFADVPAGELLLYEDAQQMIALAVNRGSAAELLGAGRDDEIVLRAS
jgi:S-adenosylmethionine hydrolase